MRIAEKRIAIGLPPVVEGREAHCKSCIERVSSNEDIRGEICYECQKIARRKRIEAKRSEQGIPIKSDSCLKCGEPKTDGRCLPCNAKVKQANRIERNRLRREEEGKRAWGTRSSSPCITCSKEKESPDKSYCNECINAKAREKWKESESIRYNKREVTLLCECGKTKSSTQKIYCDDCVSTRRKEQAKIAAREYRKIHGSEVKRSIYCSICNEIKEHQERGYCLSCERKRYLERDKPDCAKCGSIKENPRDAYCNECKRNKARLKSIEEGRKSINPSGMGRKTTCSTCGEQKEDNYLSQSCCMKCKIKAKKENRPLRTDEQKFKDAVRKFTVSKIRQGILIRCPCKVCGTEEDVQAHHDDYYKPLDVRWLCRFHHREHHNNEKIKDTK